MTPLSPPVTISGDAGRWDLHHGPALYWAEFHPAGSSVARGVWAASAQTSWELEGRIGAPLTRTVHAYLQVTQTSAVDRRVEPVQPPPPDARPAYRDTLTISKLRDSYGAALRATRIPARWADGPYRAEIVGPIALRSDTFEQLFAYRLWHDDQVVLSYPGVALPVSQPVDAFVLREAAIRMVAEAVDAPPHERRWLERHGTDLVARMTPPAAPFPPGTRVVVDVGAYREPASGTVVAAVHDDEGALTGYHWRPDGYDLPGHAYRDQPGHVLYSRNAHVQATRVILGEAEGLLALGAEVTVLDHPDIAGGTVRRVALGPGRSLRCEVDPGSGGKPVWLPETEIELRVGAAWPHVAALHAARAASGVPFAANEIMATGDAVAMRVERAGNVRLLTQRLPAADLDPILAPHVRQPAALFEVPAAPTAPPGPPPPAL